MENNLSPEVIKKIKDWIDRLELLEWSINHSISVIDEMKEFIGDKKIH